MHILIVEDDPLLREALCLGLRRHSYAVYPVKDGLEAWQAMQVKNFDLMILDLGLPILSGEEILDNIRKSGMSIPIIVLTGQGSYANRVKILESGADDYIIKPFNLEELCARIQSVHRRTIPVAARKIISTDNLTLDPVKREAFKDDQLLDLSQREFTLLQMLLENPGRIVTEEEALRKMYSYDINADVIEAHILNLRQKLNCKRIKIIRGRGYVYEPH